MRGPEPEHLRQELRDPERGGRYRRVTEHAGHDRAPLSGRRAVRANSPGEALAGMRTTLGGGAGGCLGGMFRCRGQRGGYQCRGLGWLEFCAGWVFGAAQAMSSTASQGATATALGVAPVKVATSRWRWDWSA